jgi:hypothetical protein
MTERFNQLCVHDNLLGFIMRFLNWLPLTNLETVDDALARFETRTKTTIKDKCKNLGEHFTYSIDGEIDGLRPEEVTPMNCENLLLELKSLWTNLHDTKNEVTAKEAKSPFALLTEEKDANKPAPIHPTKVIAQRKSSSLMPKEN